MKVIIHDLDEKYNEILSRKCDHIIHANGRYAPCQGCFGCWTRHPAECRMKDTLQYAGRLIGQADELIVITENCYGAYSPEVKNIFDRGIGLSTPMSTYRKGQMKHTLRYGKRELLKVFVYGDITEAEKDTFRFMAQCNADNDGRKRSEVIFLDSIDEPEALEI